MTSAAPTGVATGFPPAYSHAFNRADATAGAVALRLEGVVDGSRLRAAGSSPGVHECSIVPLVLEDMVVMNVVARLPPCFTRRRIPEEAAKKDSTISLFLVKQGGTSVNSGSVSPSSLGTCIRYWRSA